MEKKINLFSKDKVDFVHDCKQARRICEMYPRTEKVILEVAYSCHAEISRDVGCGPCVEKVLCLVQFHYS